MKRALLLFIIACVGVKNKFDRWAQLIADMFEKSRHAALAEASWTMENAERMRYSSDNVDDAMNSLTQRAFSVKTRGRGKGEAVRARGAGGIGEPPLLPQDGKEAKLATVFGDGAKLRGPWQHGKCRRHGEPS